MFIFERNKAPGSYRDGSIMKINYGEKFNEIAAKNKLKQTR